jgi:hypothetical protein
LPGCIHFLLIKNNTTMKKVLLPLLGLLLLAGCDKEQNTPVDTVPDQVLDFRSDCDKEYWICHKDGESGNYTVLCIDAEGYFGDPDDPDDQGHSGHADDYVLDADGDGLTAENPCGIGSEDDCDDTDETIGGPPTWYADADGDGYGDAASNQEDCNQPEGYVADNTDCDDADANEYPGQTWYIDADSDGYGASSVTQCDRPANGYLSSELSGTGTDDCDDTDDTVYPGAEEVCDDGIDNDCDGDVDEADSDCEGCSTTGLLTVTLPDGSTLYVHPEDQRTGSPESNGVQWGGQGTYILGVDDKYSTTDALADFDGEANTQAIVTVLGDGDYAAKVCADLVYNGCDDWYLPALGELKAIYEQLYRDVPGGNTLGTNNFAGYHYWSSSGSSASNAWGQYFYGGGQSYNAKSYAGSGCRCVRR